MPRLVHMWVVPMPGRLPPPTLRLAALLGVRGWQETKGVVRILYLTMESAMRDGQRRKAACLVTALVLAGCGMRAGAAESPPACDLTVLVIARAAAPTQVALSYARRVDKGRLRAGIGELAERAGTRASGVVIREGPLEKGSGQLATAAQFVAPGLIRQETGMLPVGAIVRSLPDWRHMRLVFFTGERFRFSGPRDAAGDGFVVRLVNEMEAYEYDVERMSGRVSPPGEVVPLRARSAPLLPGALIGAPPGLLLGWLLADRRGKRISRGSEGGR
jgi:hypothetical protein